MNVSRKGGEPSERHSGPRPAPGHVHQPSSGEMSPGVWGREASWATGISLPTGGCGVGGKGVSNVCLGGCSSAASWRLTRRSGSGAQDRLLSPRG